MFVRACVCAGVELCDGYLLYNTASKAGDKNSARELTTAAVFSLHKSPSLLESHRWRTPGGHEHSKRFIQWLTPGAARRKIPFPPHAITVQHSSTIFSRTDKKQNPLECFQLVPTARVPGADGKSKCSFFLLLPRWKVWSQEKRGQKEIAASNEVFGRCSAGGLADLSPYDPGRRLLDAGSSERAWLGLHRCDLPCGRLLTKQSCTTEYKNEKQKWHRESFFWLQVVRYTSPKNFDRKRSPSLLLNIAAGFAFTEHLIPERNDTHRKQR